jgi:ATP-dependent DNA helicase RecQ
VVIGDFDRPEIELSVHRVRSGKEKQRQIEQAAAEFSGSGIVYAATHAGAQAARDTLAAAGQDVTLYHAGLSTAARREAMTAFLDGSARVISATVAFGMGIDKPDVRWVLHADVPGSLDAYYQELGRAGRDGKAAHARLLYQPSDLAIVRHLATRRVSSAVVAAVANRLARSSRPEGIDALAGALGIGSRAATLALARLVDVSAASWTADGGAHWSDALTVPDALEELEAETAVEKEVERSRLEMMRRYAEHTGCRRSFLLSYFGQEYPGPCGSCDNDRLRSAPSRKIQPFAVGVRVESERWGEGTVQRYDGDQVTVLFDDHGYRDLLVPLVLERELLRPV